MQKAKITVVSDSISPRLKILVFEVKDVMIEKRGKYSGILFTLEVIEEKKYE